VPLAIDYGVAIYPEDGDQKEVLIHVADERLYAMKQSQRDALAEEAMPADPGPAPSIAADTIHTKTPQESPAPKASVEEKRKWERVPLAGTRAYVQFVEAPRRTVRVLDLGYGGVALETGPSEELGTTFYAVLHVPILPPVRVSLKKLYEQPTKGGQTRVGCSFIT